MPGSPFADRVDVVYLAPGGEKLTCCQDQGCADHFAAFVAASDVQAGMPPRRIRQRPCTGQHPPLRSVR